MLRVSNKQRGKSKLDSVTTSFSHNLIIIYSQISQLRVSTKESGGWLKSDFALLTILNTLLVVVVADHI